MKLLSKIRNTKIGYAIGSKILSSSFINKNPIYTRLHSRHIKNKMKKLEQSPPSIDIGTTNLCNANCIMCPHSKLKEFGTMNFKTYKKIIDEAHEMGVKNISLTFFGEPLLDKGVFEKIKYTKEKGMSIVFFSNGSLLDEKNAKKLIETGLDSIIISFDGYKKETYEKIRKNLNFDKVRSNILGLIKLKKKMNKKNPKISLSLVEQQSNTDEVGAFYKEWKEKVDHISVINLRNWAGNIESNENFKKSFHTKNGLSRPPCKLLWQKLVIDWNGDFVLCCDCWNHQVILGNVKEHSIKDIWFGEKLKKIRELHKKGEFDKIPVCKNCNKKTVWWL